MIKRIALYALLFCMISQFSFANAEMSRTDDAVVFLNAVDVLKHINSKESVEEAHQMLAGITSNYNQANMFRTYAAAIIDIYDDNFDDAQTKLDVLALNEQFNSMLEKYELQSCEVVGRYISARRAENEGRYSDAFEIYTSINFLDSLDRSIELAGKSKEEAYAAAEALFEQGMYVEAAEAFDSLGQYKDSAARATESRARVTPEPTPSPTPTPIPTLKPSPKYYDPSKWTINIIPFDGYDGDNGQDVAFCLDGYIEFNEHIGKPEVIEVSWMDISQYKAIEMYFYTKGQYADYLDEMFKCAREGTMLYSSEYVDDANGPRWYFEMALPDDPSLAGIQTIKIRMGDQIITYKGTLEYNGDYFIGNGWMISVWEISEVEETSSTRQSNN